MNSRLKMVRISLNKSQEEFGKILGITKSGVSEIESGRRKVTEQHIIMLKNHGINEEWIRTGLGDMFVAKTRDQKIEEFVERVLSDSEQSFRRRFIAMLSALDSDGWRLLEDMALAMAEKKEPSLSILRAAHNDNAEDLEELAKINRDLNNLKRP